MEHLRINVEGGNNNPLSMFEGLISEKELPNSKVNKIIEGGIGDPEELTNQMEMVKHTRSGCPLTSNFCPKSPTWGCKPMN